MARRPASRPPIRRLLASCLAWPALACGGGPPPPPEPPAPAAAPAAQAFSAEGAWEVLEAIAAEGPRPAGSPAADAARRRIREAVERTGVAVEAVDVPVEGADGEPLILTHLLATVPGASPDRFVFVAPYDSAPHPGVAFAGVNEGASGAALLVELLRVFAGSEPPYTLRFVWLEGEGRPPAPADPSAGAAEGEGMARTSGSESLARLWSETGELEGIRLLVAFDRVCDADLQIARDLLSYRWHREEFWRAAARLGRTDVFPPGRGFETFHASHLAFRERGVRPVVAIADTAFGGDEAPGPYAGTPEDALAHCAPGSLGAVGSVAVEAIETIGQRLARIDRFTRAPSTVPRSEAADDEASP